MKDTVFFDIWLGIWWQRLTPPHLTAGLMSQIPEKYLRS